MSTVCIHIQVPSTMRASCIMITAFCGCIQIHTPFWPGLEGNEEECSLHSQSGSIHHACYLHHDCSILWLHSGPITFSLSACNALGQHAFTVICIFKSVGLHTLFYTLHALHTQQHTMHSRTTCSGCKSPQILEWQCSFLVLHTIVIVSMVSSIPASLSGSEDSHHRRSHREGDILTKFLSLLAPLTVPSVLSVLLCPCRWLPMWLWLCLCQCRCLLLCLCVCLWR